MMSRIPCTPVRLGCVLAVLAGLAGAPAMAATPEEHFQRGVAAAREDDYARAVEAFEAARRAGLDTGALHYNLGTAYYGLGDMAAARTAFERAWQGTTMRAPAAYMLGRIACRQGDRATAAGWFRRARDTARTAELRRRAARALGQTGRDGGFTYLAIGAAHDTNVAASPDDVDGTSGDADSALRAMLSARRPLGDTMYLAGGLYAERFADRERFDYTSLRGGPGWRGRIDDAWHWQLDARLRHERLGGDPLRNAVVADAGVERRARGRRTWQAGYELTYFDAASGFGFLDGEAHRLEIGTRPGSGRGWDATVELERMDRSDRDSGSDFRSFSWSAAGLELGHRFAVRGDTSLRLGADLTLRDHDGTEVRDDDPVGSREDALGGLQAETAGPLAGHLSWRLRLRYEERHSSIDEFDYERGLAVGYLEYLF